MKAVSPAEIRARDWDRCANCGSSRDLHVHHRRLRSQGGPNTYANQITLCTDCHTWAHANPERAHRSGLILFHGEEPCQVPVSHFCWPGPLPIYLAEDGTVKFWQYAEDWQAGDDGWIPLPKE